jgi:hypothetical protein
LLLPKSEKLGADTPDPWALLLLFVFNELPKRLPPPPPPPAAELCPNSPPPVPPAFGGVEVDDDDDVPNPEKSEGEGLLFAFVFPNRLLFDAVLLLFVFPNEKLGVDVVVVAFVLPGQQH